MKFKILSLLALLLFSSLFWFPGKSQSVPDKNSAPQKIESSSELPGIVFVTAPIFDEKSEGGKGVWQGSYHWRDSYIYPRSATYHRGERTKGPPRTGRNLYTLIPARPDGKLTRLTHLKEGEIFKPEPYFDGKKILFSMRRDNEDWFHLYEINVDGTNLRQLTAGPFNDFGGVYLPDDRIVFCSDRTGYLEEYHEERTETLFVMNGDGTGMEQITFAPGTYFEPTVLQDGRLLYSFWDAFHIDVPPFDKHETILMTANPDGTEERLFFGTAQYEFFGRERHSGIGLTQPREMPDGKILVQSEMGPSLLDVNAGTSVEAALTPIFPGTTSVQLGGTTHRSHVSPLGTRSTAHPTVDGHFLYSKTAPGARDSAIYLCDPSTRAETLVLNIPNYAEFDAVPILQAKPRPRMIPSRINREKPARFLVIANGESDNEERAKALRQAKYLRVIQAEYSVVTTSSHTNLETRILGTVPVHEDGSVYFEAPADTPIFLDPLDAGGNRVLMNWNYPDTSVAIGTRYPTTQMAYMVGRPGETRACYGCHASPNIPVPNQPLLALRSAPVPVTRESTDLQYRRNDPEGYRRQALLTDLPQLKQWLQSGSVTQQCRACEGLMYVDTTDAKTVDLIASRLNHDNVQLRRSAALALTRLATKSQQTQLNNACRDEDWQVRLHCQNALDALRKYENYQNEMQKALPPLWAIRETGRRHDDKFVPQLKTLLSNHEMEFLASEAAVALGRIATPDAIDALWHALRAEVPKKAVHISRYLQRGPRPEEYAYLKGLILAKAKLTIDDIHLLIALLPNTFMEKPRFEDRLRDESQRLLMPRLFLEENGFRKQIVRLLLDTTRDKADPKTPLYQQLLQGINLERPFSEHGRTFPVVKQLRAEETLWLLSAFLETSDLNKKELTLLRQYAAKHLTSDHHRERIDAAVLLGKIGLDASSEKTLLAEIRKPYAFPEITSIGQGMPGTPFRDKAYLAQTWAQHASDLRAMDELIDKQHSRRDIRYGLVRGLGKRHKKDAIPYLTKLAATDPLTVIRRQARYEIADLQDYYLLQNLPMPEIAIPAETSLEEGFRPTPWKWQNTQFQELPQMKNSKDIGLSQILDESNFRNLNNAQIRGAEQMMIASIAETNQFFANLPQDVNQRKDIFMKALASNKPHVHYQVLRHAKELEIPPVTILDHLKKYSQTGNTVGLWWCCEALADLQASNALPVLLDYCQKPTQLPATQGPPGLFPGYVMAKTVGRIIGKTDDERIQALLHHENQWIRAGVLCGLAEVHADGLEPILEEFAEVNQLAAIRYEAQVQRQRMAHNRKPS